MKLNEIKKIEIEVIKPEVLTHIKGGARDTRNESGGPSTFGLIVKTKK